MHLGITPERGFQKEKAVRYCTNELFLLSSPFGDKGRFRSPHQSRRRRTFHLGHSLNEACKRKASAYSVHIRRRLASFASKLILSVSSLQ